MQVSGKETVEADPVDLPPGGFCGHQRDRQRAPVQLLLHPGVHERDPV